MATEENDAAGRRTYLALAVKVAVIVVFPPFIALAVWFNAIGIADRTAALPGIKKEGGAISGIVALLYLLAIIGLVAGGVAIATGSGLPVSSISEETPEPRSTALSTGFPTATSSPMPTTTVSEGVHQQELDAFKSDYRRRLAETYERNDLREVPVLSMEYHKNNNGKLELWVVWRECDEAQPERAQRLTIAMDFANTIGNHNGITPDRLRSYGVTDLVNFGDKITYINASEAEAAYNRTIEQSKYVKNWWTRQREPTAAENETAYEMAVGESGRAAADDAFYDDHVEVGGWCADESQTPPPT